MDLRLKTAFQLSSEEQKFLDEETTNKQVVQSQASAAAMVQAEKDKAAGLTESEQRELDAWKRACQGREQEVKAKAEERYRVSVQWAKAGRERAILWLQAAKKREIGFPSAKAHAYVLRYEQTLDGWQGTLKLYESREPFYRMNDHWADILLAAENYPTDKENRYYYNKKGMRKIRKLREWTDIRVTRYDRNGLWGFPEEADKWL